MGYAWHNTGLKVTLYVATLRWTVAWTTKASRHNGPPGRIISLQRGGMLQPLLQYHPLHTEVSDLISLETAIPEEVLEDKTRLL